MSKTTAEGSEEAVLVLLTQMANSLEKQQQAQETDESKASLKNALLSLHSISSPSFATDLLARHVFTPPCDEEVSGRSSTLDCKRSLAVLSHLVSLDPKTYLKPGSRSVRAAAEALGTTDPASGCIPATTAVLTGEVLAVIVSQLGGEDVESADNASATLVAVSKHLGPAVAVKCVLAVSKAWNDVIRSAEAKPDTKRSLSTISIRCASTIVDLACLGDAAMDAATSSDSTDLLLSLVSDPSDPLMQMSALDLLERMATTLPIHGSRAKWLFDRKVVGMLLEMAGSSGQPDPFSGGPALRTLSSFCKLAHMPQEATLFGLSGEDSELLSGFMNALHCFEESASGENDRLAFVDAVSSFSSASPRALAMVLNDPVIRDGWLSLNVSQPKLKSVILFSIASCIDPPSQTDSSGDTIMTNNVPSNLQSQALVDALGTTNGRDATDLVLSAARAPLAEIRLGAYALLNAFAKRGTGAQILLSHNEFYEFLVDREKENTKEGKEAKHEIVNAVLSSDARPLLADSVVETLEKISKQGPHYVNTQPYELAMES